MKNYKVFHFILIPIVAFNSFAMSRTPHINTPRVMIFPPDHLTDEERKFQGIPGLAGTATGRYWATWYGGGHGEDGNNVVMLATSGDGGNSWSDIKIMIDAPWPIRCFDPVVWIDPRERLWLFWGQAYSHGIEAHTWAMVTENPEDENPAWKKPFIIAPGVMMNKPAVLQSGDWLLPISDWEGRRKKTPGAATAGVIISRDHGKSFKKLGAALVPHEHRSYDEHIIVERNDGSLWMLVRTQYGIGESISRDAGKTWSEVTPSPVGHVTARFFIRRLESGNLLMVKHGDLDQRLDSRSHLTAYLSKDDGESWEGVLLIDKRADVSYPDGFQDNEATIHIIYDYSRRDAMEILMASFTEEDVLSQGPTSYQFRQRQIVNKATGRNSSIK